MLWRALWGLCLLVLAIALGGMWGVSAAANIAHAYQSAGSNPYAHIFAGAALGADVFKAAAAIGLAMAVRGRLWGPAAACLLIWLITTAWSVHSLIGFSVTLVTEGKAVREESTKTATSNRDSIQQEISKSLEQLGWLRPQMTHAARGANAAERESIREERRLSLEKAEKLERRIDELRKQLVQNSEISIAAGVVGDPTGRFLQQYGVQPATLDIAKVILLLLLIEVCSNIAGLGFGHMYSSGTPPARLPPKVAPAPVDRPLVSADIKPPELSAELDLEIPRIPRMDLDAELARLQHGRAPITTSNRREQVQAYLEDLRVIHGAGAIMTADDVVGSWPGWACRAGIEDVMARHLIGQQLSKCSVLKFKEGGQTRYRLP